MSEFLTELRTRTARAHEIGPVGLFILRAVNVIRQACINAADRSMWHASIRVSDIEPDRELMQNAGLYHEDFVFSLETQITDAIGEGFYVNFDRRDKNPFGSGVHEPGAVIHVAWNYQQLSFCGGAAPPSHFS